MDVFALLPELSGCDREPHGCKKKNIYFWPFTENNLLTPSIDCSLIHKQHKQLSKELDQLGAATAPSGGRLFWTFISVDNKTEETTKL